MLVQNEQNVSIQCQQCTQTIVFEHPSACRRTKKRAHSNAKIVVVTIMTHYQVRETKLQEVNEARTFESENKALRL